MAESVDLPSRLAILPFRNKVLLPGAIIRIRCTSPSRYFLRILMLNLFGFSIVSLGKWPKFFFFGWFGIKLGVFGR